MSSFKLTLDTLAPDVVFGEATGTTAGEFLRIPYVSNEPIEQARLRLPDGSYLAMGVAPDAFEVLLPHDANAGWAGVEVRDDVWNARLYAAVVQLQGVPLPPPPSIEPAGGLPRPARRRRPAPEPTRRVRRRAVYALQTRATASSHIRRYVEIPVLRTAATSGAQLESVRLAAVTRICAVRVDGSRRSAVRVGRSAEVRRRDDDSLLLLLFGISVVD